MPTKVRLVKAMVFPVVMSGCESWIIKKPKHWRIDDFELWCCRRFLRVSWTARISNQSIIKKISLEYSLEGLMLKLKLQYLMLGKIESRRRRGQQRMRWLNGITNPMDMSLNKLWDWWWTGRPGVLWFMGSQRVGHDWVTEMNWTELWLTRLLRVPWTVRRSKQSVLKEISPECSLEGLTFKLKVQYFGHLMWRTDSFEKTLMLGKIEGRRRMGRQRMRWLDDITNLMNMFE